MVIQRSLTLSPGIEIWDTGFLSPCSQGIHLQSQIDLSLPSPMVHPTLSLIKFTAFTNPLQNQEFLELNLASQRD